MRVELSCLAVVASCALAPGLEAQASGTGSYPNPPAASPDVICYDDDWSEMEKDSCVDSLYVVADARLNAVYKRAMDSRQTPAEQAALRNAQRAWIKRRDATEAAMRAQCAGDCGNHPRRPIVATLTDMTNQRADSLAALTSAEMSVLPARISSAVALPALPIVVTFRKALLGGGLVAKLQNSSSKSLQIAGRVWNPSTGENKLLAFALAPGQLKEVGHLEGWTFAPGHRVELGAGGFASITVEVPLGREDAAAALKADLRGLVVAQEGFFAENQDYAGALGPAQVDRKAGGGVAQFTSPVGNAITIRYANANGYSAVATHTGLDIACGVFVGAGSPPAAEVIAEGAPACWTVSGSRTHIVRMTLVGSHYRFEPAVITVRRGDKIHFVNQAGGPHNVSFWADSIPQGAANMLSSAMPEQMARLEGPLLTEDQSTYVVDMSVPPGRYLFYCLPHLALGMRGTVIVEDQ